MEHVNHVRGHVSLQRWDIDLLMRCHQQWPMEQQDVVVVLTFINTFKLFPVHCLKLWPCVKQQSPGNNGASAMLRV
jgi:hypothetical protein